MAKLPLTDLTSLENQTSALASMNANFDAISKAFDNTYSRDGTNPNQLDSTLDVNGNRIINVAAPINPGDVARLADVTNGAQTTTVAFPSQTMYAGDYLTTDGTNLFWAPLGGASLQAANNLSDVISVPTSRSNLGLGSTQTPTFANLNFSASSGASRALFFQTGSSNRWNIQTNGVAESGGNVGSDFAIARYDDTGTFLNAPFVITRSTGTISLFGTTYLGNGGQITGGEFRISATPTTLNADSVGFRGAPQNTQSTSYTFVLGDSGCGVSQTGATPVTWTVPLNATVPFPMHTTIVLDNQGAGTVTVAPISGVSLRSNGSSSSGSKTLPQYTVATLYKVGTDVWTIVGV